jgi:hypothetical protein
MSSIELTRQFLFPLEYKGEIPELDQQEQEEFAYWLADNGYRSVAGILMVAGIFSVASLVRKIELSPSRINPPNWQVGPYLIKDPESQRSKQYPGVMIYQAPHED